MLLRPEIVTGARAIVRLPVVVVRIRYETPFELVKELADKIGYVPTFDIASAFTE